MTRTCPKCGSPNPPQAAFCHNCATALGPQQPNPVNGQQFVAAQPQTQKAMISMILAIAAFLCCGPFLGIPAAILGWLELTAIKEGRADAGGKTMATVGLWGGIAATVLHVVGYGVWVLLGMLSANPYGY